MGDGLRLLGQSSPSLCRKLPGHPHGLHGLSHVVELHAPLKAFWMFVQLDSGAPSGSNTLTSYRPTAYPRLDLFFYIPRVVGKETHTPLGNYMSGLVHAPLEVG